MANTLKWHYCPKCAWIGKSLKTEIKCKHCNTDMIYLRESKKGEFGFENKDEFIRTTIKANPLYSEESHNQREHIQFLENNAAPSSNIRCRCGSTSFQLVPRKWSLLAGIFTNKVDRVCTRCGKRF